MRDHGLDSGILVILLGLCALLVAIAFFVFWIWMLIDAIKNPGIGSTERIVWVLVIVFLHFLGALIYWLVGRSRSG